MGKENAAHAAKIGMANLKIAEIEKIIDTYRWRAKKVKEMTREKKTTLTDSI